MAIDANGQEIARFFPAEPRVTQVVDLDRLRLAAIFAPPVAPHDVFAPDTFPLLGVHIVRVSLGRHFSDIVDYFAQVVHCSLSEFGLTAKL